MNAHDLLAVQDWSRINNIHKYANLGENYASSVTVGLYHGSRFNEDDGLKVVKIHRILMGCN